MQIEGIIATIPPLAEAAMQSARARQDQSVRALEIVSEWAGGPEKVAEVWEELIKANDQGLLTIEIFSEEDFVSSLNLLEKIV